MRRQEQRSRSPVLWLKIAPVTSFACHLIRRHSLFSLLGCTPCSCHRIRPNEWAVDGMSRRIEGSIVLAAVKDASRRVPRSLRFAARIASMSIALARLSCGVDETIRPYKPRSNEPSPSNICERQPKGAGDDERHRECVRKSNAQCNSQCAQCEKQRC